MSLDHIDAGDPAMLAASLATRFTDQHGRAPDGVFAAPGRVNLIGEHTDYNGGLCLPIALPHATYAAVGRRDDGTVTVASVQEEGSPFQGRLDELGPGQVKAGCRTPPGCCGRCRRTGSTYPRSTSSWTAGSRWGRGCRRSAALECSVALAACAAAGVEVDDLLRQRLVKACMRAEAEVAGAPPAAWTRRSRCSAEPRPRCCWTAATGRRRRFRGTRPPPGSTCSWWTPERRTHWWTAGTRRGATTVRQRPRSSELRLLRDVADQSAALRSLSDDRVRRRVRHVVQRDRPGRRSGRADRRAMPGGARPVVRGVARVVARRLRGVVRGARRCRGHRHAAWRPGGPDDRRWLRRLCDRAGPHEEVERVSAAVDDAFRAAGWPAPGFLTAPPSDGARQVC